MRDKRLRIASAPDLRRRALWLAALFAVGCSSARTPEGFGPARPLRADTLEWNGWERDADLQHLELDLTLDHGRREVAGSATSHFRGLVDDTREIRMHAAELEIEAITDDEGRALTYEHDGELLRIELARPLDRGEEIAIEVRYSARPERGLYFKSTTLEDGRRAPQIWSQGQEEDNRAWFPTWDYPNDRFTYRGRFRVGDGMTAVSNGVLLDEQDHGGGERSFTWEMEYSLTSYLVALAAGRWERYEDRWRGIPVEYYVAPEVGEEKARRAFGETPEMLEFFSELFGYPYPYSKYAQVAVTDFMGLGMENTTVTIQTDEIVVDADAALDLDGNPRLLVAHELAHQWFGDLVTCLRWSDLWLNEAWASYAELLFEREKAGLGSYQAWLERYRERYLMKGALTALPVAEDWRSQLTEKRAHHVYDKGPWILHMLHVELGDAAFWQATRDYLQRHAEGLVTSADFWRTIFDSTGRNVEGFLEQWVEGGGHPVFEVRFDPREAREGAPTLALEVRQIQTLNELVPLFVVELGVDLYFADGSVRRERLPCRLREQRFELTLGAPLADLVFDADCDLLCQIELEKPAEMWARQSRLPHAGLRWRSIEGLLSDFDSQAAREVARAAHLERMREDSSELVRARAAQLWHLRREPRELLALAFEDPDARVRLIALTGVPERALTLEDRASLEARLAVELSPAVRAAIVGLLGVEETREEGR